MAACFASIDFKLLLRLIGFLRTALAWTGSDVSSSLTGENFVPLALKRRLDDDGHGIVVPLHYPYVLPEQLQIVPSNVAVSSVSCAVGTLVKHAVPRTTVCPLLFKDARAASITPFVSGTRTR
eukprot:2397979-Rhodomonas_salina.2